MTESLHLAFLHADVTSYSHDRFVELSRREESIVILIEFREEIFHSFRFFHMFRECNDEKSKWTIHPADLLHDTLRVDFQTILLQPCFKRGEMYNLPECFRIDNPHKRDEFRFAVKCNADFT